MAPLVQSVPSTVTGHIVDSNATQTLESSLRNTHLPENTLKCGISEGLDPVEKAAIIYLIAAFCFTVVAQVVTFGMLKTWKEVSYLKRPRLMPRGNVFDYIKSRVCMTYELDE